MMHKKAVIFGGTGQIGSALAEMLLHCGYDICIPTRTLDHSPSHDGFRYVTMRSYTAEEIARVVEGADVVINCIGILYENAKQRFEDIHATLPGMIAEAAATAKVGCLIHISAIGADDASPSAYARSKAHGEANVIKAFPHAAILRPSIVFGPKDSFFNRFAGMARWSPFLPLIGGGHTRFQPVYVEDIAVAVSTIMGAPERQGTIYALGGPTIYTFKELMRFILKTTGMRRILLPLPLPVAQMQALLLEQLPEPLLTRDQLKLLRVDNVVPHGTAGFHTLNIAPRAVEAIVPGYLAR